MSADLFADNWPEFNGFVKQLPSIYRKTLQIYH